MTETADKPETEPLLKSADISRLLGVKPRTVRSWVDDGCPVAVRGNGRGQHHKFRLSEVKEWRGNEKGEGLDYTTERARLLKAQRTEVELRIASKRQDVLPTQEVVAYWGDMIGAAKAKLLSLPVKAAPLVMSCVDMAEVQHILDGLVREALNEISGDGIPPTDSEGVVETPPEPDSQPVGKSVSKAKPRGKRRTRPVADKSSTVSAGNP
jgi:phage terminase Nu1 subunit (DNA packaging protein)